MNLAYMNKRKKPVTVAKFQNRNYMRLVEQVDKER